MRDAMPLSDRQIERYSRQIIVPGIGGLAQERLLASRLTICGDARDIEAPLAYLVGAGIGEIAIVSAVRASLGDRMCNLNPDVSLSTHSPSESRSLTDLSLTRERSARAKRAPGEGRLENGGEREKSGAQASPHPRPLPGQGEGTESQGAGRGGAADVLFGLIGSGESLESLKSVIKLGPTIVARFDEPALIAILPLSSPCPRCADILAPFQIRSEAANFVAMLAATELLKLVAGLSRESSLIEFDGFVSRSRAIAASPNCECSTHRKSQDAG